MMPATGRPVNALTVDVEDYFQVTAFEPLVSRDDWPSFAGRVEANVDRLLALLEQSQVRATFFVLGWTAERYPRLVRRIAERGHELGCHSFSHRLVYQLTPAEFREDVRRAKSAIECAVGLPVLGFRAPSFSITAKSLWAFDVLVEEGFAFDSSVFPIFRDRYGLPGAPRHQHIIEREAGALIEIPPSTIQIGRLTVPVAGGGYFRLFPYEWTRRAIAHINAAEGQPAVVYVHPWEIDPAQPRMPVTGIDRFRHYVNLGRTEQRLRLLLKEFAFGPVSTVFSEPLTDALLAA